jgi:hypothetical protein
VKRARAARRNLTSPPDEYGDPSLQQVLAAAIAAVARLVLCMPRHTQVVTIAPGIGQWLKPGQSGGLALPDRVISAWWQPRTSPGLAA